MLKRFTNPAIGIGAVLMVGASATAIAQMENDTLVTPDTATHVAHLSGDNEVPAVDVAGTGTAWLWLDPQTGHLRWTVEYSDLTGDVTGAHFHGPAGPDENAGVVLDLTFSDIGMMEDGDGMEGDEAMDADEAQAGEEAEADDMANAMMSPIEGEAELTDDQLEQLANGLWYVNIHTEANPGGEIRGQVEVYLDGGDGMMEDDDGMEGDEAMDADEAQAGEEAVEDSGGM